jgi:hypothetical protein
MCCRSLSIAQIDRDATLSRQLIECNETHHGGIEACSHMQAGAPVLTDAHCHQVTRQHLQPCLTALSELQTHFGDRYRCYDNLCIC